MLQIKSISALLGSYFTEAGRNAAVNLVWLVLVTIGAQLCSMAMVYFLTTGLSQEHFGIVSFALTMQTYLMIVGMAGLPAVIIREGKQQPEQLDEITTAHFVISSLFSGTLSIVVLCTIVFVPVSFAEKLLWLGIIIGNIAICINLRPLFDMHHQQAKVGGITLFGEVCGLVAIIIAFYMGELTIPLVGAIYAAKWLGTVLLQFVVYHLTVCRLRLHVSRAVCLHILRSSWLLMVITLINTIPLSFGVIAVRLLQSKEDTAILGLATQVNTVFLMFATIGFRIVRPHIAGPYGQTPSFIRKLGLFIIGYLSALWVGLFVLSYAAIIYLLDSAYHEAIAVIALLLLGAWLSAATRVMSMYYVDAHRERTLFVINTIVAVCFVVGCMALVPYFSYYGAAWMTVAGFVLRFVLLWSWRKELNREPRTPVSD